MDGLYLHIPFCASKCGYCNFCSGVASPEVTDAYTVRLIEEISERCGEVGTVDTVYFGGGTPGVLPEKNTERIVNAIRGAFRVSENAEWTFETNPETFPRYASVLKSLGFNRVSLGLQATQDRLLKAVGRRHTFCEFSDAVDALALAGIDNLSVDLMLGLPGQTLADVRQSLETLADFPLKHYSVYGLKVEKDTPLFRSGFVSDDDREADFYREAVDILARGGYYRYETSNFSLPGFECRHNVKYWTLAPYLGLGLSAHSDTGGFRSENTNDTAEYLNGKKPKSVFIGIEEREEEFVILGLRTEAGITDRDFADRFGRPFRVGREQAIGRLAAQGVLKTDDGKIRIAPAYAYVANSVIVQLI